MSGGWADSDRRDRLPADWPARVKAVKKRAGGKCEMVKADGTRCRAWGRDVDHIARGDDHELTNLQYLCPHHHGRKSAAEGLAARREIAANRTRPPESHPGRK